METTRKLNDQNTNSSSKNLFVFSSLFEETVFIVFFAVELDVAINCKSFVPLLFLSSNFSLQVTANDSLSQVKRKKRIHLINSRTATIELSNEFIYSANWLSASQVTQIIAVWTSEIEGERDVIIYFGSERSSLTHVAASDTICSPKSKMF